ncbi:MAG: NADH-ubiquinone oxidoreductase-F iron-sulfur binding region domain-containing protein [Pseudomonadota bacterium]
MDGSRLVPSLPRSRTALLPNLGRLRREIGPVTPALSDALADHMGLRRGEVADVASSYAYLDVATETVRVCTGPACDCMGARELLAREREHGEAVEVACLGHCDRAPFALRGDDPFEPVEHTCNDGPSLGLGRVDATLADYGPFAALGATPREVLAELEASCLRGLGGAGFPTFRKWAAVRAQAAQPVVVVNADEGEPGTIKDRYVLERRPHLLLEGLLVAMRTVGASEAWIYLREEYARARARLLAALDELRDAGLLDGRAVGLVVGAGSYVCGEESALLESMEGRRPMPRLRPPFPAEHGLLGRPTLVNNVETLAHVPAIVGRGGAWFAGLGIGGEHGTRLYSLSGAVARPGCYEAPCGITIRELVEGLGGGATEPVGAIVPGGAASGILPPDALDLPLTDAALRPWSAAVGSAAVQVFPERYPVLRLLAETMRFFAEESCQKCTPCRIGNRALHTVAVGLADGLAPMTRAEVERWLDAMERTSICGLGQAAPLPFRAAMRHWPELFAPLGEAA